MITKEKNISPSLLSVGSEPAIFVFVFVVSRAIFIVISVAFNTAPYICSDDLFLYSKITNDNIGQYLYNAFIWRNNYYFISSVLNNYGINEYFSASRLLNIILMLSLLLKLHKITVYMDIDRKTRIAFLVFLSCYPYYIIYSFVQLREILCLWGVVSLFEVFFRYIKEGKINWIYTVGIAVILYTTRTGILEIMVILFFYYIIKDKKFGYRALMMICLIVMIFLFLSNSDYMYVIGDKFEVYFNSETQRTEGMLSQLRVKSILDIYKLIILLPYVQISPLPYGYLQELSLNSWGAQLTFLAGIPAFLLPYFWTECIDVLKKRIDELQWILIIFYLIFLVLIAISQPNNARFPFFISPIYYLFSIKRLFKSSINGPILLLAGMTFFTIPYFYMLWRG